MEQNITKLPLLNFSDFIIDKDFIQVHFFGWTSFAHKFPTFAHK